MLEEQQSAGWPKYPVYFAQGPAHVADAAQGKRADGAIEAVIRQREPFAADHPLVNCESRPPDSPLCQAVHSGVRIDGRDRADLGGIVRQVQARPKTDLQNV